MKKNYDEVRLVLGDQLNLSHSWFKKKDNKVLYVLAEVKSESKYVKHHVQKIIAIFTAMRSFADALKDKGHHVYYLTLDDTAKSPDFPSLITKLCKDFSATTFSYQRPDEYRLLDVLEKLDLGKKVSVKQYDTEHFLVPFEELSSYITAGKANRLETFYRKLRQRFDVLMNGEEPEGGRWNFDTENRQSFKKKDLEAIPKPLSFSHDTASIVKRLDKHNIPYFGEIPDSLLWPCDRKEALKLLRYFCEHKLENFGRFQDAMVNEHDSAWSLYHSRLSFALNTKILSPKEVLDRSIQAYQESDGAITLAQIEGFVRQILGWREYIRAVYWVNMPDYRDLNVLSAKRALPQYFWDGETKMNCMSKSIGQSLEFAYAHHIQRLMVTGNFCLLSGIDPDEVDAWYLGIYIDAFEWVEMPNTRGMSQFADNGLIASKPYAASSNYINKMSDYCKTCHYKQKAKTEDDACPFNSMYWNFMVKHRKRFEKNPRIGMIYRNWDKQDSATRDSTLKRAKWCLTNLEKL